MDTLQTTLEHETLQALRQDPALQSLMERLPAPVRDSFAEEQLAALKSPNPPLASTSSQASHSASGAGSTPDRRC